ncbi:MAG TPA: OmpA family protein [Usitatibacter sp.]|nr:OmpA family protein [Usitatibacter sp.]
MKLFAVWLLATLLASFLRAPERAPELFAVLPARDGHIGAIAVRGPQGEHVINSAYGALRISGATQTPSILESSQVREMFGDTIDALPGSPTSFMLYFVEGKDELTTESQAQLEDVFAELKRRPLPDIVVIGHTDTVGALDFNDRLSRARAERMRELLVERGLPGERIQAAGRGKRELLVPTEDNVSEPRNRRVEINVR